MYRAFSIVPHFRTEAFPRALKANGIDLTLYCVPIETRSHFEQVFPQADWLCSFDIVQGKISAGLAAKVRLLPASVADIEALSRWEGRALQMIDRFNGDRLPLGELRYIYLRYIGVWRSLVEHYRPDAVTFHGTPHAGFDFVLYQICKLAGIRTLMVERTYLDERLYIRENLTDSPCPTADEIAAEHTDLFPVTKPEVEVNQLDHLNRKMNDLVWIQRGLSWPGLVRSLVPLRSWRKFFSTVDSREVALSTRPWYLQHRWHETYGRYQLRQFFQYYSKNSQSPEYDKPYVFFPMHYQPERSTLPDGGQFCDMTFVAETIASALPAGWKLLVKEHPRQFTRGNFAVRARTQAFYERLVSHPSIRLVPLESSSRDLIANAKAITTVTGTSGWEALQVGKPVLVFGVPWYLHAPGVARVESIQECQQQFARIERGEFVVDPRLVAAYSRVLQSKYTFRGLMTQRLLEFSKLSVDDVSKNIAEALRQTLDSPADAGSVKSRGDVMASFLSDA